MKLVALLVLLAVVVASAATTAAATSRTLQSDVRIDAVASGIAGFPVTVAGEDDPAEWAALCSGCADSTGFTVLSPDDPRYRKIFIAPDQWATLERIESMGLANVPVADRYAAAVAILSLAHEAFHQKLDSLDEGRVNACAVAAFPQIIETYFGVAPTVRQTSTTTRTVRVRRVVWARVDGRRVRRVRWTTKVVRQTITAEVSNLVYHVLVDNALTFYKAQPPPYSTGVCS